MFRPRTIALAVLVVSRLAALANSSGAPKPNFSLVASHSASAESFHGERLQLSERNTGFGSRKISSLRVGTQAESTLRERLVVGIVGLATQTEHVSPDDVVAPEDALDGVPQRWRQAIDVVNLATQHGILERVIAPAVFVATLVWSHLHAGPSADAKTRGEGRGVGEADVVFQLRVPSLHLAMATLVLLAGSLCAVCLAACCGAHVAQDSLRLWHVVSAEGPALSLLVAAQVLWNGVQVLQCFVVVCSWVTLTRGPLLVCSICGTFALLPLSLYVTSIGGYVFACLTFMSACGLALAKQDACLTCLKDGSRTISVVEQPNTLYICKVQALMCMCYLFGGLYNETVYTLRASVLPNWGGIFDLPRKVLGESAATSLYGLGLDSAFPGFIEVGWPDNADVIYPAVFAICWSFVPLLYTTAFIVMLASCRKLPKSSAAIAQTACVFVILHFLFFTDLVCYRYGRGFVNPWGDWAHVSERVSWRIGMLLPLYQKAATGDFGCVIFRVLLSYGAAVFVYQVLIGDVVCQGIYASKCEDFPYPSFWMYFTATTVFCCLYGLLSVGGTCQHLVLSRS